MNIGFDAKRAFHNTTGLGHYSRNLLWALSDYYPGHRYFLFNPKPSAFFKPARDNMQEVLPGTFFDKTFSSAWRSSWVKKDLKRLNIDLYHGLSHEIPAGIQRTGVSSVVTMHDLIHERYPEQYNPVDVKIYRQKFRYACKHADRIIAISEQTKKDILEFYGTPAQKIRVCYQHCNPAFGKSIAEEEKIRLREKYSLPAEFFLYVGSIIARKNLLHICKAMNILRNELPVPLVVIGDGGTYKQKIKEYIRSNGLEEIIIFLSEKEEAKKSNSFQTAVDFPAIYQMATAMIYPSFFEGFGIPVLEALWSRLPVITSRVSCLPEAGGDGAYYVDPASPEEIAAGMRKIYSDKGFAATMKEKGWLHAQNFTPEKHAASVMNVYESLF